MSIFLNEAEELTEKEAHQFLYLAKKFYKARRASVSDIRNTDQIAWLEGQFSDSGDGIESIKIAMSTRDDFLTMIAEIDEEDMMEFENEQQPF